jgi:DNA modification methylase
MPFTYHPPTRQTCEVCQNINGDLKPIVDTHRGKASAADNFPIHNWYNFVLGYTPEFPDYVLNREKVSSKNFVVDPFLGSGTTMVCCKAKRIPSAGVEANDFFEFAAKVKLNWELDPTVLRKYQKKILENLKNEFVRYSWPVATTQAQLPLVSTGNLSPVKYAQKHRPQLLLEKYVSDSPFTKLQLVKNELERIKWPTTEMRDFFCLAYSGSILPASNIRYGPGFGVIKPKMDIDVLGIFTKRLERMISDIESISDKKTLKIKSEVYLGDARQLSKYLKNNSVDFMITSPPYPGDHEYTKHSKLELMFNGFAHSLDTFREIKQRMLRGSTTNIYKNDNEGEAIRDIKSISRIVEEIDKRLKEDKATSGFEKLYTKLIWEYFGGMYKVFQEAQKVLKPGGKFSLLVSDSHAFKMVHIETAELLKDVAEKAGFSDCHIELWQYKISTSHKYKLLENILTIEK